MRSDRGKATTTERGEKIRAINTNKDFSIVEKPEVKRINILNG